MGSRDCRLADRCRVTPELVNASDVDWEMLIAVSVRLLEQDVDGAARLVAEALNASITPAITPFRYTGPACGLAQLIHLARTSGDCRLADAARQAVQFADSDRLLADAYEETWPSLRVPYGVPVASWSNNPADYRLVPVNELPAPWNLRKSYCPASQRYHELEREALTGSRLVRLARRLRLTPPLDEQTARATAWRQFHAELASDHTDVFPCEQHTFALPEWEKAVDIAYGLLQTQRPWQQTAVYHHFLKQRQVTEPLPGVERLAWSLLADPIRWHSNTGQLSNGQHRACGAVSVGLSNILVQT